MMEIKTVRINPDFTDLALAIPEVGGFLPLQCLRWPIFSMAC